jgi:hypothetical protein
MCNSVDQRPGATTDRERVLRFFEYEHLPFHLQAVSRPFQALAATIAYDRDMDGVEAMVCLRKLLEAKDAAVRARL